jgi:hypothetical protein
MSPASSLVALHMDTITPQLKVDSARVLRGKSVGLARPFPSGVQDPHGCGSYAKVGHAGSQKSAKKKVLTLDHTPGCKFNDWGEIQCKSASSPNKLD